MDSPAVWIIPVAVLGAIVGSFLNVVIYRLPLGLSITRPRWSFCPHCRNRIRPYDNLPVIGWFLLRGRCRDCGGAIAAVYPVVECATALLFAMVWDALFVGRYVPGIHTPAADWPLAVGYACLFASLLAISGMDLESYSIDIRVSVFALIAGILMHGAGGLPSAVVQPAASEPTGALPPALCVIAVAMGLTWLLPVVMLSISGRLRDRPNGNSAGGTAAETTADGSNGNGDPVGEAATAYTAAPSGVFQPLPVAVFCLLVAALLAWQLLAPDFQISQRVPAGGERGFVACFLLMLLLVLASMTHRDADQEIVDEIESGRPEARSVAGREFVCFIPALVVGIGLFVLLQRNARLAVTWQEAIAALDSLGKAAPHVAGALHAAAGAVFAAALGWSVRILGTLTFGKEAFGTGDIYILASIGAVAGFWNVVFGFFLAAMLALVGVIALSFKKSSRAIPFGPWLALGAFAVLWLQGLLLEFFGEVGRLFWSVVTGTAPWSVRS